VIIEDNVWIGMNVSIAPGAIIEEGCVVGLNSVVFGKIPKCSVAYGNPAKVIKNLNVKHYEFLKSNSLFLNDIRGFNYYNYFKAKSIIRKIRSLIKDKTKVYDHELDSNSIKPRSIMFSFTMDHDLSFNIQDNAFYIEKK